MASVGNSLKKPSYLWLAVVEFDLKSKMEDLSVGWLMIDQGTNIVMLKAY